MKYTSSQIELLQRHAGERMRLLLEQENARVEMESRQGSELREAGIEMSQPQSPGQQPSPPVNFRVK